MRGTVATLSTIKIDGEDIDGFSADKLSYTVFLPKGTTIVPDVDA